MLQHGQYVGRHQIHKHQAGEDQIEVSIATVSGAPVADTVVDDVHHVELPCRSVGEYLPVTDDQVWYDVDTGVVYVISCHQELTHPAHVTARDIKETDTRQSVTHLQLVNSDVQLCHCQ